MPKGEIYKRQELSSWIRDIRKRSGMSVASFGASHFRFMEKNGKMSAVHYKRVAVSYWENGNHLPSYPETIASLAMMDYDLAHKEKNDTKEFNQKDYTSQDQKDCTSQDQNDRMNYVISCIAKYLGKKLYCKNFTDLLILHAARGMFPLVQVPDIYNELMEIILKDTEKLTDDQRKVFVMRRDTNTLFARLLELENLEELKEEVRENRHFYSIGYRVVGERLQALYEKSYEEINHGMDFLSAVRFYAPVYRDSVKKLTSYEVVVSRRWLIDLCLLLHFDRADINEVLLNAQYIELSDLNLLGTEHPESLIVDLPGLTTGSAEWFAEVERNFIRKFNPTKDSLPVILEDTDFSPLRFFRLQEYTEKEKLLYVISVGCLLLSSGESFPLPLYVLDYVLAKPEMKKLLKSMAESDLKEFSVKVKEWIVKAFYAATGNPKAKTMAAADECNPIYELLKKYCSELDKKIEHPGWYHHGETMQELRLGLTDEYASYYEISAAKVSILKAYYETSKKHKDRYEQTLWDLACGSYFSALCYTVFTGYLYKGSLYSDEMAFLKNEEEALKKMYPMLRFCFSLYLGKEPVYAGPNGGILIAPEDKRELNFPRVLIQLLSYLE